MQCTATSTDTGTVRPRATHLLPWNWHVATPIWSLDHAAHLGGPAGCRFENTAVFSEYQYPMWRA